MAKYKIGDKVRVRCDLELKIYGSVSVVGDMIKYRGKVVTIAYVDEDDNSYKIAEEASSWHWWSEEMFEPVGGNIMQKFNVGDRVVWRGDSSTTSRPLDGKMGKVVAFKYDSIGIEFDNHIGGHSCNGIGSWGHCWWCDPTDLALCVQGGISPASLRPANPDTSTLKNLVVATSRSERYESLGKHKGKTISQITTTVTVDGRSASATCDETDYSERQGVLEALGNLVYGDFDKAYNKMIKTKNLAEKKSRTCTYCGQLFGTVADKEEHEAWHVECRKARHERYLLRKRAKEIAFEEAAQKLAKEIIAEDNKK